MLAEFGIRTFWFQDFVSESTVFSGGFLCRPDGFRGFEWNWYHDPVQIALPEYFTETDTVQTGNVRGNGTAAVLFTKSGDLISGGKLCKRYHYRDGFYDGEKREFSGFGYVEEWTQETAADPDYIIPAVCRKMWFQTGGERLSEGKYDLDAGAYPMPEDRFSISCRLGNLNAGIAGGEEKPKLKLERAEEEEQGVKVIPKTKQMK